MLLVSGTLATTQQVTLPTAGGSCSILGTGQANKTIMTIPIITRLSQDCGVVIRSVLQAGWGYDFRRNMSVAWGDYGNYATDIFTDEAVKIISQHDTDKPLFLYLAHLAVHSANTYSPLQAPQDAIDRHDYIEDENRRKFSGMLYKLDESVGKVVESLAKKNMLQDCIIVFTTDNGGPAAGFDLNHASNWPLRGVSMGKTSQGNH